jgi:hypothetical protein
MSGTILEMSIESGLESENDKDITILPYIESDVHIAV